VSLQLKQLNYEYALQIDKIWQEFWSEYSLPDDSTKVIDAVVVDNSDRVLAYGQVKMFAELMLFTDMDASLKNRMAALHLLMAEAFRGSDRAGLKDVYCLIKDIRFARLVAKHFGFTLVMDPGILLVKHLGE